jgi:hypothetical protein
MYSISNRKTLHEDGKARSNTVRYFPVPSLLLAFLFYIKHRVERHNTVKEVVKRCLE